MPFSFVYSNRLWILCAHLFRQSSMQRAKLGGMLALGLQLNLIIVRHQQESAGLERRDTRRDVDQAIPVLAQVVGDALGCVFGLIERKDGAARRRRHLFERRRRLWLIA